ncbi:TM2 domain protein [Collinsella intestinalis]|nr:TM2 domain protein [Collinsella intestinalis]
MQGYEKIKELKQLLDEGLITQEEYDQKKTELLSAASADAAGAPIGPTSASFLPDNRVEKRKSKWVAGLTAIFLGCYGVHKFYLGYAAQGAIMLAVTLGLALPVSFIARALGSVALMKLIGLLQFIPILIGVAEGVIYLIKSEEDFQRIYVAGCREWF